VDLGGADGLGDPRVCSVGSVFPMVQKIQYIPDVFLCYALYFCIVYPVHVVCHGTGDIHVDGPDYDVGAGMSYANDIAVDYEIDVDYDVLFDRCGGVSHRGAVVHNVFQDYEVIYGDNVADDVLESHYVVYGETVVLGNVVQADYVVHDCVVQPASVVHGDNVVCEGAFQSDYVVHVDVFLDDKCVVQIGTVIHGDNVVLDDEHVVQVGSVIHDDNLVQYDDDLQNGCAGMTDEAVTAHSFAGSDTGDFVMKHYYMLIDWNDVAVYGMFQPKT
jgi:hypothetical protein